MKKYKPETTLGDLGEDRIIKEIISPRFPALDSPAFGIGDDCAVIPSPGSEFSLTITTDPCPTPIIGQLDPQTDFYHYGRLSMLVNVSDLGAMGARPLGFTMSTVMPEKMLVSDYKRFLDGLYDASVEWSCPIIGGNIKDGSEFTATGTALGCVRKGHTMYRVGAKVGDYVCVIGEMGLFWSAILARLNNFPKEIIENQLLQDTLYKPSCRIYEGIALAESLSATTCMDSSDGISGCLHEIASLNKVDILIKSNLLLSNPVVMNVSELAGIDVRKLLLSWGNWELVCTVNPSQIDKVKELINSFGTRFSVIGEICNGVGEVWLEDSSHKNKLNDFASRRFSSTSTFTHGLESYLNFLKNDCLVIK
jgi:thiamine-monophosphate kinase